MNPHICRHLRIDQSYDFLLDRKLNFTNWIIYRHISLWNIQDIFPAQNKEYPYLFINDQKAQQLKYFTFKYNNQHVPFIIIKKKIKIMVKGDEGTRILYMIKPAMAIIPEIENPDRKITFRTKLIWTGIITLIYLLCCQIPLYGMVKTTESDPFYWMRVILASNRGSLMELGISPLVTSSMIMQMLSGAKLIKVDQSIREEKQLFSGAQKLIGVLIAFGQAFAYTWSGMYGDINSIGAGNAILIVLQLTVATIITILLDDMMSKGYGVGQSGTSLFIAINIAESVLWKAFSPLSFKVNEADQFQGAFIALIYGIIIGPNRGSAVQDALFRSSLPNISNVFATVLIFCIVIYFQGFKVTLSLSSTKQSPGGFPIKLFYTSNMPIILQTALVSNLYFFSQMLHRTFRGATLIKLLGNWQEIDGGQSVPVGGLIYFLTPPRDFIEVFRDPIHTILYIIFVVGACALFSRTWIDVSGQGSADVARNLKEQGMFFTGHRDTQTRSVLQRYIPTAATFGGMCIGALTIVADFLGAIGSGTGILLTVTIIYGYIEEFKKQKQSLF